jgi:tetratricopeptide (TPR) repeat protein
MAQERRRKSTRKRGNGGGEPPPHDPATPTVPAGRPFILNGPAEPVPNGSTLAARKRPEAAAPTVEINVKAEFRPTSRAVGQVQAVEIADDDVLEIEFAEGQRVWMRGKEYRQRFGGAPSRDGSGAESFLVPEGLQVLPRGMESRGPIAWTVKSLKVLGVDLHRLTAREIARMVETRKGIRRKGLGLFRCRTETEAFDLLPAKLGERAGGDSAPLLVFIHGTASSTWGSFGELWSKQRGKELAALREAYGERVFAFEHETLAVSPIENALSLARELPAGAHLHLVTHSRGGLVGELLCRAGVDGKFIGGSAKTEPRDLRPFEEDEFRLFEMNPAYTTPDEFSDGRRSILESLQELDKVLKDKAFQVERFVRVACPALGSTLVSERLDRWVSVIGSLAAKALPETPLSDALSDMGEFFAAVVHEHTDPRTLPGLEAMMPDSALIRLVNWPRATVPGDLFVIAGDIEPDAWWAKLLVWATDRFYEGDHDLVVNTPSMYGGARREGRALASFHKGPSVNHFTYFRNTDSARRLVGALTRPADTPGFEPLVRPTVDIARAVATRAVGPQPVVFVVPGIMGSELAVGKDRVWLDIPDLIFGGFEKLRIDAAGVRATELFSRYYGALVAFLAATHKVVPFPFDWRLRVEEEADRLAEAVRSELEESRKNNQPVRILAHSMGGLVARAMIGRHGNLWRELCAHPGARLMMLGTPNGGSHSITELLVGRSSTLRKLDFIDVRHSSRDLLEIMSRFPGVLAMLPKDSREDYSSPDTWAEYHRRAGAGWVVPNKEDLDNARSFRRLLDDAPVDPKRVIYVAGCADVTIAGMYLDAQEAKEEDRIKFEATARGDGRVTWDSGIPPDVPTWYMDVEHGDLPAHEEAFPALLELLQSGNTTLLPRTAPVSRAAGANFPLPRAADVVYPDEDGMQAAALGAGARRRRRAKRREPAVRVRAVHGSLAFARFPVALGHYKGDTIISAEKAMDRELDGELTRRHQLGLYPGALETSTVFANPRLRDNPRANPKGAIVIGLGTAGALSVAALTRTFTRALLEYDLEWFERLGQHRPGNGEATLGVSTLLIGTGAGGVSVADSVFALLQGVACANDALAASQQAQRITEVEFIELWEDRAIQVLEAFTRLERDPELKERFTFERALTTTKGACRRASYEEAAGWWHRIQILGGSGEPGSAQRILRFAATTRRARSEVSLLPTQRDLVDRFVEQAIRTTQNDRAVSHTLFELLLPNELKEAAPDEDDIVLLLDEESARYPWELLEDPSATERRPFVIKHGVLRQLELKDFRETVQPVTADNALVVGDPISPFVELKGAQAEAKAVAHSLEGDGKFHVELLDRPRGDEVMHALYDRPYRILHLAGHGVYHYLPKEAVSCQECGQTLPPEERARRERSGEPVTGMVIGDGMFLTPIEVRQMRQVPELVFINCCHLGRVETTAATEEKGLNAHRDYNLIAASVATEFIRMGVRAVIAAGWAVDDGAAATFARTFYDSMLQGEKFGEAVKLCRKETYGRHLSVNTWGAYQCYGDPDYRLFRDRVASEGGKDDLRFATSAAAVTEIENLAAALATMGGQDTSWQVGELRRIAKWFDEKKRPDDKSWLDDGRICIALARAFGEALLLEEAKGYYGRALDKDPASMTLKDLEQYANLISRAAVDAWKRGEATKGREPLAEIDKAIGHLEWLVAPPSGKETSERLSLFGSAYKRRAWIAGDLSAAVAAVGKMTDRYSRACRLSEGKDPYPVLNLLFARLVDGWVGGSPLVKAADMEAELGGARAELDGRLAQGPDFWAEASRIDCDLLAALGEDRLDSDAAESLASRYREARKLASRREFASVLDQIEFLAAMATMAKKTDLGQRLRKLLDRVSEEPA